MIDPTNPDYADLPTVATRCPSVVYAPADPAQDPHVTIVTPFFNVGPIFQQTARSVLAQSFQQWEWLIVNDASTDPDALALLTRFRHGDPRIRVIDHQTNRGLSAARNTGFRNARTDYVVILDGDDLLEPTAVEKWFWFLETHPDVAFCKGYSVGFGAEEYLWERGFHSGRLFLDVNQVDPTSMIRRTVHDAAGGYDEDNRGGLEDWEFWLRCASRGHWGATVPEYLNWYRRRPAHTDRWTNWDNGTRQDAFRAGLRRRFPGLWNGKFPKIEPRRHMSNASVLDELSCANPLRKGRPRLLMLVPWLAVGGADKFNLDLLREFIRQGWEVTVATTLQGDHPWLPEFTRLTPDVFVLEHFLPLVDYPRFLRYLMTSRCTDQVLITHSEFGYQLLPYLRAHFPNVTYADYCHIEEEQWKNGGYPRLAVEYQEALDVNVVSSEHLKQWMIQRGAEPERIEVCYTNIDVDEWRPDPALCDRVRDELEIDRTAPVILYTGRICAQKQPRVFAQTIRRLHRGGHRFTALVAGDGPEFPWLRSFVQKHKLTGCVRLLGVVPNERIKQLMAAVDLLFLPSRWEGIALTVYEAMACGLPIVGADVGGQRELVTPECGLLIAQGDEQVEVQQYAEVLAELITDPERCKRMGRAGRTRIAEHFRLSTMGERMHALLQQTADLRASRPRPRPNMGLGRACAAQAVEYVRVSRLADQLWARQNGDSPGVSIYLFLTRWLKPLQRWGMTHGWIWLGPLGDRVKRMLLQRHLGKH